jgi:hypothetical protein
MENPTVGVDGGKSERETGAKEPKGGRYNTPDRTRTMGSRSEETLLSPKVSGSADLY